MLDDEIQGYIGAIEESTSCKKFGRQHLLNLVLRSPVSLLHTRRLHSSPIFLCSPQLVSPTRKFWIRKHLEFSWRASQPLPTLATIITQGIYYARKTCSTKIRDPKDRIVAPQA